VSAGHLIWLWHLSLLFFFFGDHLRMAQELCRGCSAFVGPPTLELEYTIVVPLDMYSRLDAVFPRCSLLESIYGLALTRR
jgi:hypothetical protein